MLNDTHFKLIAGNPRKWDDETRERVAKGEDLPSVQISQFARGRRSAEVVQTIYGWSVRSATNLDNRAFIARRCATLDEAIAAGTAWANEDPENREFFIYRKYLLG